MECFVQAILAHNTAGRYVRKRAIGALTTSCFKVPGEVAYGNFKRRDDDGNL